MDLELARRTAFVSGSHRGTGAAVAQVLAREGARVIVHGFELEPAESVASSIRDAGGRADAVAGDIRNDAGAAAVIEAISASGAEIDVLVNNYGVAEGGDWNSPTADWIDVYEKNVLSGVRLVQAFTPGMRARGFGRVIFVSTVGTTRPAARMPHYYASKMALLNMTQSLAKELAGTGITVNCISPGLIATEEIRAHLKRQAEKRGASTDWESLQALAAETFMPNPTGLVTEPEEVGALVAYLASPLARTINATNLRIDAGAADATH